MPQAYCLHCRGGKGKLRNIVDAVEAEVPHRRKGTVTIWRGTCEDCGKQLTTYKRTKGEGAQTQQVDEPLPEE